MESRPTAFNTALQSAQSAGLSANVPQTATQAIESELLGFIQRISEMSERTEMLAGRLFGGGDVCADKPRPPQPAPSGALHSISSAIDNLRAAINRQEAACSRLDVLA